VLTGVLMAAGGVKDPRVRDTRGVRATGLQGDTPTEIIEILDDDNDVFGDRAPNTTIRDAGGPRWVGPVAAAALVALIGYGVATSVSDSAVPTVASAPSTSTPPVTTQPAPTTTIPQPVVPYYAADPPREFTVEYADIQHPSQNYYGPGNYQLWATPQAIASSGSWFSIEGTSENPESVFGFDAYRLQSSGRSISISHLSTGQSVARFSVHSSLAVTLTSFGWNDEDLARLALSVGADGDDIKLTDMSLIPNYQMISGVPPWLAVQGTPTEQIFYTSSHDLSGDISISVAQRPSTSAGGATLDREVALRFLLDHPTPFAVDGHVAVAGSVIGQRDFAVATWIAGDHIVTVSAATTVQELIAVARTVHQVSSEEWSGLQFQAARHSSDNNFGKFDESDPKPVSSGTDADSVPWTIDVALLRFPNDQQISWQWDGHGFGSEIDDTAKINTVVDNRRTYVLADLPRSIAASAQLQITRSGLDPVLVPFVDADPSSDRTFAAYAFSEPTFYTARIIGPDGAVLANWPSE
jgi:hypothetical protein